jgi:hypothetical protein
MLFKPPSPSRRGAEILLVFPQVGLRARKAYLMADI